MFENQYNRYIFKMHRSFKEILVDLSRVFNIDHNSTTVKNNAYIDELTMTIDKL